MSENDYPPGPQKSWRFDPVDIVQMRLLAQLPPGWRIQTMLEAQAFAKGLILGRLRRIYPNASEQELGLKLLEEVSRESRSQTRGRPADKSR